MNRKESTPKLSVITVNYQGFKDTREFINSWIERIQSISYELIIIDNASPTNDYELLKKHFPNEKYPQIKLMQSHNNGGFAAGNNLGIQTAEGKYLFFLNNDVLITEDKLTTFIERLEESEKIAGVSPLLLNNDEEKSIQFAGYTPLSLITLRNKANGIGSTHHEAYPASPTPYLHGAAMMIKKSVIEKVGIMPTFYFLYYEELDWCSQMTQQGYELWYDPCFKIIHKESCSTGKESPLKCYYLTRNRLIYTTRFRKGIIRILSLLYQVIIVTNKNIILTIIKGEPQKIAAYYRGVIDFINYIKERKA
ncbi:MAG: glycosyltransferase family 2 protein [Phocaeicola sp.]